jgi:hypothetical protein
MPENLSNMHMSLTINVILTLTSPEVNSKPDRDYCFSNRALKSSLYVACMEALN